MYDDEYNDNPLWFVVGLIIVIAALIYIHL